MIEFVVPSAYPDIIAGTFPANSCKMTLHSFCRRVNGWFGGVLLLKGQSFFEVIGPGLLKAFDFHECP